MLQLDRYYHSVISTIEPEPIPLQAMKKYDTYTPNGFVVGIVDQLELVRNVPSVLLSFAEFVISITPNPPLFFRDTSALQSLRITFVLSDWSLN